MTDTSTNMSVFQERRSRCKVRLNAVKMEFRELISPTQGFESPGADVGISSGCIKFFCACVLQQAKGA